MKRKKDKPELDLDDEEDGVMSEYPDLPLDDAIGFNAEGVAPAAAAPQDSSTAELQTQLDKISKDYLYLRAEFENYRRQAIKERGDLVRYAGEKLARDLLDTLDIFETALAGDVTPEGSANFVKGIQLTAHQLRATLQKHGIQEVPSQGQPFDPTVHEALASEPTNKVEPGHISQVFKKPYKYHDKVIRTGQVVVAKSPDEA